MRSVSMKRIIGGILVGTALAVAYWFASPAPIPVDIATAAVGPMEVTVDDDARTRVRHVYTVSAPVAGKVLRISEPGEQHDLSRHIGDEVIAGETIVAVMQPMSPSFLDIRSREELQAAAAAAEAAVRLAEAEVRRIEAALEFSRNDLSRAQALARTDTISVKVFDKAKLDVATNEAALASAKAQLDVRRGEQAVAAARMLSPTSAPTQVDPACCIQLRSPVSGRVLKIIQESEATVPAGAPLIEIGDPLDLEISAELLSTEAVRIKPGAPVRIDGWGGSPISGRVKRVDPAGFLKISALGIEEQRVRTIIDFVDPPAVWSDLGHDFRVVVHVRTWNADKVLTVPVSALFRRGDDWTVFAVKDGRVRSTALKIGHRNSRQAEVLSGLSEGDQVVLHPSDRVRDGIQVKQRETD